MDWLLTKTEAAPAGDRPGGLAVVEPALAVKSGQTDAAPFYACGRPQLRGVDVQYDGGGFLDLTDLAQLHIVGKSRHPVARAREGTEVAAVGSGIHKKQHDAEYDDSPRSERGGGAQRRSQSRPFTARRNGRTHAADAVASPPDFEARKRRDGEQQEQREKQQERR